MRTQINLTYQLSPDATISFEEDVADQTGVSNVQEVGSESAAGYTGFHLAEQREQYSAVLNGSYRLYDETGYRGYISSILSDAKGVFTKALTIPFYVTFERIYPTFCIVFDRACGQYATRFRLTNETTGEYIEVDNNQSAAAIIKTKYTFWGDKKEARLTLSIYAWSSAYSNARVTSIAVNYSCTYTGKDLIKYVGSENSFPADLTPYPGLCEQYVELEVYDRDNALRFISEYQDASIDVYLIDDTTGEIEDLGGYAVTDTQDDTASAVVKIYCKDVSCTFDRINVPALSVEDRSADDLFALAFSRAGNVAWKYSSDFVASNCKNTITPNSWTYSSDLKTFLNKVCVMSGTRVYYYKRTFIVTDAINTPYSAERLTLSPREYLSTAKLALPDNCRVDTVLVQPLSNQLAEEASVLHTEEITDIFVRANKYSLPVSSSMQSTHWRCLHNDTRIGFSKHNFAKSRMECIMAEGSCTITLDRVPKDLPTVRIGLQGTTKSIPRGTATYDAYPTKSDLSSETFSLSNWIDTQGTSSEDKLSWSYDDARVSMNPWIRNIVAPDLNAPPTDADIITTWTNPSLLARTYANLVGWYGSASFGAGSELFDMLPVNPSGTNLIEAYACAIRMQNLSLVTSSTIEKIGENTFRVSWKAPVRVSYAAASRTRGPLGGWYDLDNFAFVDYVTKVSVELIGHELSTDTVDIGYSNDVNGDMTSTALKNVYPVSLEKCELFTTETKRFDTLVTVDRARTWLQFYDHLVHTFVCTVPAEWAIKHKISVGTHNFRVVQPNGNFVQDYLARNTVFALVNIEKRLEKSSYVYELKLIERTV